LGVLAAPDDGTGFGLVGGGVNRTGLETIGLRFGLGDSGA